MGISVHHILLVEDSEEFQKIIVRTISHHKVDCAISVEQALDFLSQKNYDLILLDITLPGKSGYSLLAEMQSKNPEETPPIICLTGRKEVHDKVAAFSLGADDYMVKPFDPIELRARVDAKLNKHAQKKESSKNIIVGSIEIDPATCRVRVTTENSKQEVHLTQTEFKLLMCLARRPDQVYTRAQLIQTAWGDNVNVLDRVVDVHLCSLRKKMGEQSHFVKSIPGVGYKLTAERRSNTRKSA